MTPTLRAAVLRLLDSGHTPAQILATLPISRHALYRTLRAERPRRKRAPRRLSLPAAQMLGLHEAGIGPVRIGELVGVRRQYVYRILKAKTGPGASTL